MAAGLRVFWNVAIATTDGLTAAMVCVKSAAATGATITDIPVIAAIATIVVAAVLLGGTRTPCSVASADIVPGHQVVQGRTADAEQLSRLGDVAVGPGQRLAQRALLGFIAHLAQVQVLLEQRHIA